MTNETQQEQHESYNPCFNPWRAYEFLEKNCSKIVLQGVPYAFVFRFNGTNVPDEVPIRVWNADIDRSLLDKLREKIPSAFDEKGNILENTLRDLLNIPLREDTDNEVSFRKNLAKLCGYDYHPEREQSGDDCGETYWYTIPAKFEKIEGERE
jgi:hypothetical protein